MLAGAECSSLRAEALCCVPAVLPHRRTEEARPCMDPRFRKKTSLRRTMKEEDHTRRMDHPCHTRAEAMVLCCRAAAAEQGMVEAVLFLAAQNPWI